MKRNERKGRKALPLLLIERKVIMRARLRIPMMCDSGVGTPGDEVTISDEVGRPAEQSGFLEEIFEEIKEAIEPMGKVRTAIQRAIRKGRRKEKRR